MGIQMTRDETEVVYRDRPSLTPLLELLDEGRLVTEEAERRRWNRVVAFGDGHLVELIRRGTKQVEIDLADEANVVTEVDCGRLLRPQQSGLRPGPDRVSRPLRPPHGSA
jgi:hypothetical protein